MGELWVSAKEDNKWLGLRHGYLLFEEFSPRAEGKRFGPVHLELKRNESVRERTLQRLTDHGVKLLGPQEWKSGRFKGVSYYFYDPEDNLLEYWVPSGQ